MNVFTFSGNLGRDVKTNDVNGTAVANFVVAVKSGFGDKEQTLWLDCALWGKRAEGGLVQYLNKGQQVVVSGELGSREYQGTDGTTKTALTCRVNDINLVGGKPDAAPQQQQYQQTAQQQQAPQQQQYQQQAPQQQQQGQQNGGVDDDIPFAPMYHQFGKSALLAF